jgi:aspartate carbamoyltransferase catalytic subunit
LSDWTHRHVLDLAAFSLDDYATVLELAQRFRAMPTSGARKLPALQGRLVTTFFFEPSTRTRSSFELAARRLSADVQSFSPSSSSLSKGESLLDTVRTYVAMGAELLVVRHRCTGVPARLARDLEASGERVAVLNGGDGLHSHPSQGLLDLFTLARHFAPHRDRGRHPPFACGPLQPLGPHRLRGGCGAVRPANTAARRLC